MWAILSQVAFSVGRTDYDWADVVVAAKLRGDWAGFEEHVRQGLACVARTERTGERPGRAVVTAAAQEFRYDRDLTSAEEMEAWLGRFGLTPEAWMAYIERSVLRQQWSAELREIVARHPPTDAQVEALLEVEGVCSGAFERFASTLAGSAAVYEKLGEDAPALPEAVADSDARTRLARIEGTVQAFRATALTPRAIRDQLATHHLDWIRFESRCLAFADEPSAREGALAVREDGLELDAVAGLARATVQESGFYLEEVESEVRDRLLGARNGEVIGPVPMRGQYALIQVVDKVIPSDSDPEIRRRAEEAAWRSLVEREMRRRVRWRHLGA